MIVVQNHNGNYAPVVMCDHCSKRIDAASDGTVLYPKSVSPGQAVPHFHVHKGKCDQAMDAKHGGGLSGTDDLDTHMAFLLHNLKLTGKELQNALKSADVLDAL